MKNIKYMKRMRLCTLSLAVVLAFSSMVPASAVSAEEPLAVEGTTNPVTETPYRLRTEQVKKNVIKVWLELDPANAESVASYQIALQLQNNEGEVLGGRGMTLEFDQALENAEVKDAKYDQTTQTMNVYVAGTQNLVQTETSDGSVVNKLPIGTLTVDERRGNNAFKVVVNKDDGDFIFVGVDHQRIDASEKYGKNGQFTIPSDGTIYGAEPYPLTTEVEGKGIVKAYLIENGSETLIREGSKVDPGKAVRLTVTPDAGYRLSSLTLALGKEEAIPVDGNFTFLMTDACKVNAVFEEIENKFTVTVGENASIVGTTETSKEFKSRETATVTVKTPEGKKFSHWTTGNGTIVSYDAKYSFVVLGDITLTPVFVAKETAVEVKTSVLLDGLTTVEFPASSQKYRMSFSGQNILAKGCTIVERGIILINQEITEENLEDFKIDGYVNGVKVAKIPLAGTAKQFIINVNNVKSGQLRVGRAYLTYKDANGKRETIYGETWMGETVGTSTAQ